jgi:hypothetical protein
MSRRSSRNGFFPESTKSPKPEHFDSDFIDNAFIPLPFGVLRLLRGNYAIMLSFLVMHDRRVRYRHNIGAWCYLDKQQCSDEVGFSPVKQRQLLQALRDKGLLQFMSSETRWNIRLHFRQILRAIADTDNFHDD